MKKFCESILLSFHLRLPNQTLVVDSFHFGSLLNAKNVEQEEKNI